MKSNKKIAFVLGGGSIKGAYQIGLVKGLIENRITPDIITGISVGSLNSILISDNLGRYKNWNKAINKSVDFWLNNIKKPSDIINKKSIFRIAYEIFANKFNGILDTKRLERLIHKHIKPENIIKSGIDISVGAVNIDNGSIYYAKQTNEKLLDFAIASTRIPLLMPVSEINSIYYYDGGLIDNAGIGEAIRMGADTIYVLATHPEHIKNPIRNKGNIIELVDRIQEIIVNNTLNNDIDKAIMYNSLKIKGVTNNKKVVDLVILRPKYIIDINITDFTSKDIENMINLGYKDAKNLL